MYGTAVQSSSAPSSLMRKDQVQMIHLRRYLDYLGEQVAAKEHTVQKTRYVFSEKSATLK